MNGEIDNVCEYCGSTKNVKYCENPFDQEINDDDTEHWICDSCYQEAADDI
jgi:hypothetical protein